MFDWIAKLFGGGNNQQKSSSTTPSPSNPGPGLQFQIPSLNSNRSSVDYAAQAREEERRRREEELRRREEERRAKEAAEAAKRARQEAEARANQAAQQKTVAPLTQNPGAPGLPFAPIVAPRPNRRPVGTPGPIASVGAPIKGSRADLEQRIEDNKKGQVRTAKANLMLNQLWAPVQSGVYDTVNLPSVLAGLIGKDDFARDWSEGVEKNVGGIRIPGSNKTYKELIDDTERAKDQAMREIYRNGGELSTPEKAIYAGAELFGSLVSPTEAAAGIRAGTALSRSADNAVDAAALATGGTARTGRLLDDAADSALDAAEAARRAQIAKEAERAAAEAEDAIRNLPNPTDIERQATDAGRIDDGISSPSRVQQVRQTVTQQVDETKAAIQEEYQRTLMGLGDLWNSMTPQPLAMQAAGAPDIDPRLLARQADFDVPEQALPPQPVDELPAPSKTPITQAIESPNEAASKAAADATPPVAPKEAAKAPSPQDGVKTRTIDDMSDEEIMERFGTTREEMVKRREASRAAKEAEEAKKAEKQKAKEERAAQKAAALEQAAIDAGEAPAKKSNDLFAGKRVADQEAPKDTKAGKNKRYTAKEEVDSLFQPGGTKTNPRTVPEKATTKAAPKKATAKTDPEMDFDDIPEYDVDPDGSIKERAPTKPANDLFAGKRLADQKPAKSKPKVETKTVSEPTSKSVTDLFDGKRKADKKRTVASAKTADTGGTPPPNKTPPKNNASDKPPIDTDYIMKKAETDEKVRSNSKTAKGTRTRRMDTVTSRNIIEAEAEMFAKNTPVKDFIKYALGKKRLSPADEQIARAYIRSGRVKLLSPEMGQLEDIRYRFSHKTGKEMGTQSRFDRNKASHQEITMDYNKKLSDVDLDMSRSDIRRLDKMSAEYTKKRDAAAAAKEKAISTRADSDIDAMERAMEDAYHADRAQRIGAYEMALKSAKAIEKSGEKLSPEQFAALRKMKQDISIFQYDAVDSSLLSATGTMINNFANGLVTLIESSVAGKASSRLASKWVNRNLKELDRVYVGGSSIKGTGMGFKEGVKSIRSEVGMRNEMNRSGGAGPMKKLWGAYKNTVTTANEISETTIRARIQSQLYDHYMQVNKSRTDLKGKDLKNQTRIDALTDPLEIRHVYEKEAYITQGMSSLSKADDASKAKKLEKGLADLVSNTMKDSLGMGDTLKKRDFADYTGKLVSRFFVGFPSVVWKSGVVAGAKRTPLVGIFLDARTYRRAATPQEKAQALSEGLQHAASSAGYAGIGVYLGSTGIITGAYPSDPNEQERWQAEGKTEWSIKIGSDYYDIRKSLGAFALPVMMFAQIGQNMADKDSTNLLDGFIPDVEGATAGSYAEAVTKSPLIAAFGVTPLESPLARVNDVVDAINGKNGWADIAATGFRMTWPAGGFFNQLAKMTTSALGGEELEARDKDSQMQEFINRLAVAVPGGGEALGLDAKQTLGVDQTATSVIGRIFGAQKGYNPEGAAVVQRQKDEAASVAETTRSVATNTFNKILETMDEDTKGLYKRVVQEGKTLRPENQKQVDDAIAGLADGDKDFESKFSEEGDWETQAYILQKKKQKYETDKSTKPEKIREIEREIARTDILSKLKGDPKKNATLYKRYKEVAQSELKKMLDPEDTDNYNPELAMKLVEMDNMFTKAKLSWKTDVIDGWTKKKYDLDAIKKALKGRGGGGSKKLLATNVSGLKVMESEGLSGLKYKTVGGMPNLMAATPRKNFKKTISIKRGVQL